MLKKIDKKICALAVGALILTGTLIWLAFFQQLEKVRELSDNIQKEQLDSLVRDQRSQKIIEMGKELGDVEKDKNEMEAMLIDKDNAVPFLKAVEGISASSRNLIKINVVDLAKLKSKTTKKPTTQTSDDDSTDAIKKESQTKKASSTQAVKQDFSDQLGFSIELTGRFQSLVDFLTKLENLPYFVRVYDFQVSPADVENKSAETEEESKNIKTILTIGVYTNGTK